VCRLSQDHPFRRIDIKVVRLSIYLHNHWICIFHTHILSSIADFLNTRIYPPPSHISEENLTRQHELHIYILSLCIGLSDERIPLRYSIFHGKWFFQSQHEVIIVASHWYYLFSSSAYLLYPFFFVLLHTIHVASRLYARKIGWSLSDKVLDSHTSFHR
jgi:hypothetical protein